MVLVSHRHRFIFFKTKKTASTSVEMFFEPFCLPEGEPVGAEYRDEYVGESGVVGCRRGQAQRLAARWPQHLRAASVLRRTGPVTFFRYFRFATVRDPYSRTLSAFRYTYRKRRDELAAMDFQAEREAFNEWLEANYHWVQDRRMYMIAGVPVANAFIRYEHLADDIVAICRRLDLPCDLDRLPHVKAMPEPERPAIDYYTPRNRRCIARTYAWEMRAFGYPPPRPHASGGPASRGTDR